MKNKDNNHNTDRGASNTNQASNKTRDDRGKVGGMAQDITHKATETAERGGQKVQETAHRIGQPGQPEQQKAEKSNQQGREQDRQGAPSNRHAPNKGSEKKSY